MPIARFARSRIIVDVPRQTKGAHMFTYTRRFGTCAGQGGSTRRRSDRFVLSRVGSSPAAWRAAVLAPALLLWATTATGIAPMQPAPPPDLRATPGTSIETSSLGAAEQSAAWAPVHEFARATGSRWMVMDWAPAALTPRLAAGNGYAVGGAIEDAAQAERAALGFIAAHSGLFRTDPSRLSQARVRSGAGKWSVIHQEMAGGVPILGGRTTVLLTEDGRLAAFGASTFPMIRSAAAPSLDRGRAEMAAAAHLRELGVAPRDGAWARHSVNGPYVLPVLRAGAMPAPGSSGIEGRTIWRVTLVSHDPAGVYEVDVDAQTGAVLQRVNVLRSLEYAGTATGSIERPNWCEGFSDHPTPGLFVAVQGAGVDTTDAAGAFAIAAAGTDPATLTAEMKGLVSDVYNVAGSQAFHQGVITPGVPYELVWTDENSRPDERDTYDFVTAMHALVKSVDPQWTDLDFPLPCNVNLQQGCNAFWDGGSINMFHEQGGCANTGRIGDVIAHEYAHGITDFMYGTEDPPGDVHEGNSDVAGNYLADSPIVGRGFYLDDCVNGIRNSDNDLRWPEDLHGEGHYDGQILAGFHWHARANLIADLGYEEGARVALTTWHFARVLGLPYTQPEQVWWTFLADDDDANLDNGTPHFAALCQAAQRHGFSCPEVFDDVVIHHTPMAYGESPNEQPIAVRARMYSFSGPLNSDSLLVYSRPSGAGSFTPSLFEAQGQDNLYQAWIPGQPMGTYVDYYLLAVDAAGHRLRRPAQEDAFYTFQTVLAGDPFEEPGDWTVGAPGDNATTGIWERVDPIGTTIYYRLQPEDDATPDPGHICWITGQYTGGQPFDSDADGITTLFSPLYDLTGMAWATVRFNRWFQSLNGSYGSMDVSVTTNGGVTWRSIDHPAGLDADVEWTTIQRELNPLGGQLGLTQFKFVVMGEPVYSFTEGGLDDFVLLADDQAAPSSVEPPRVEVARPGLRLVSANPGPGLARFEYALEAAGPASLAIYGVGGKKVRSLLRGELPAGVHTVVWDGLDEAGRPVASGTYFAKLDGAGGHDALRFVIAR